MQISWPPMFAAAATPPTAVEPSRGPDLEQAARFLDRYDPHLAREAWKKEFPGGWLYEPTLDAAGTLYVGGGNGELLALGVGSGELRWRQPTGTVLHAPALAPDHSTVYASTLDSEVVALGRDGQVRWRRRLDYGGPGEPAVGSDGRLYLGSMAGRVVALSPQDGAELWSFPTLGAVQVRPTIAPDGSVYARDNRGMVYALDLHGKKRWQVETQAYPGGPITLGQDGLVLVADWKDVKALDPASGEVRWRFPCNPARESGVVVGPDGAIYVAGHDQTLTALNADGSLRWQARGPVGLATTPQITPDGTLVVRAYDRSLLAFSSDGQLHWRSPTFEYNGASIMSEPAVGPDGTVYAGNQNGTLVALRYVSPEQQYGEAVREPSGGNRVEVGSEWVVVGGVRMPVRGRART